MADNTAAARKKIEGHRSAIRDHIEKYKRYPEAYEKQGALRTIERAQEQIRRLKADHPSLQRDTSPADTWRPPSA